MLTLKVKKEWMFIKPLRESTKTTSGYVKCNEI